MELLEDVGGEGALADAGEDGGVEDVDVVDDGVDDGQGVLLLPAGGEAAPAAAREHRLEQGQPFSLAVFVGGGRIEEEKGREGRDKGREEGSVRGGGGAPAGGRA